MNALLILEILGWLLIGLGALQTVPAAAALWFGETPLPYLASGAAALAFGLPVALSTRAGSRRLRTRDGFVVVSAAWALASLFGAFPFVLTGVLGWTDAWFESVAGFTTTGSTVLTDIEAAPAALLLWRSLTQWLGGMGIIVFAIAVLPLLGIGGMQLFRAEVPGPVTDKLTPRISVTARRLWLIYLALTALCFLALRVAGMDGFDALCHALTTLATGGFSTRNASVGAFGSAAIEWVVVVFMFLAGVNYVLHYRALTGRFGAVVRDSELRLYVLIAVGMSLAIAWILSDGGSSADALRRATFQVVSLLTTTGFGSDDYERWGPLCQVLVLPLLVLGGMAGSTSGAVKTLRILLALRLLRAYVTRATDRHAVRTIRYAGRPVAEDVVSGIGVFLMAYFAIALLAAIVVASAGYDVATSLSAALTALGNVGPGLGAIGPTDHFAHFPGYVKICLSVCMVAGRLEVFTLLVLFDPKFWRR